MISTSDYEGMFAETVAMPTTDGGVHGYMARPLGGGPFPSVLLLHHLPGWDSWYRETTRKFAQRGYVALSPDLYCRIGHGAPDDVAALAKSQGGVSDEQVLGDAAAGIDFLRSMPFASGEIALFGTCSGARHAFLVACRIGQVNAVIDCWGGRIVASSEELTENQPVAPIDLVPDLDAPVLGLFGNDDANPSPQHVDQLEEKLAEHGKRYEFYRYDDAGHGFFDYDRPHAYRAGAAVAGWEKIWNFLESEMDSTPRGERS